MKKYLSLVLSIFLIFSLSSCFWKWASEGDIEDTKKELLNNTWNVVDDSSTGWNIPKYEDENDKKDNSKEEEKPAKVEKETYTVEYLWDNQFLEIDNLDKQDFKNRKVVITWKTLTKVDKIIVNFSNSSSKFPDDRFQLARFKAWDDTFTYNAYAQYEVLDYWTNEYLIEAYSWDEISKTLITIYLPEKDTSTSSTQEDKKTDSSKDSSLTSSSIKWLKMWEAEANLDVSTSNGVTEFLAEYTPDNAWFYWNTSRPIASWEWMSVYVIRLDGSEYVYEKYYYLPDWTFGVLELETWTWVDKENIMEKNNEFKEKNEDFDTTDADKYFKDKLNS